MFFKAILIFLVFVEINLKLQSRDFRLCTQRFDDPLLVDSIHKQVEGCLQNFYQSVAIHLKYVVLVLL